MLMTENNITDIVGDNNTEEIIPIQDIKIQWHPAFSAAMKLELRENKEQLDYFDEYNLNHQPLQIDLLVIKKRQSKVISNELGKLFRGHNIVEFKSTDDSLNLDTYIKVLGYACLYKSYEEHVGDIALDDITITFIRERYPRELMKWFAGHDYVVNQRFKGVYYITKEDTFLTQIVVVKDLDKENHTWLTSLTMKLKENDIQRLVNKVNNLYEKADRDCADSVLQVSINANRETFDKVKEAGFIMCEALRDLFKDEIEAEMQQRTEQVKQQVTKQVTQRVTQQVTQQVTQRVTQQITYQEIVKNVEELAKNMKSTIEQACKLLGKTVDQYNEAKANLAKN